MVLFLNFALTTVYDGSCIQPHVCVWQLMRTAFFRFLSFSFYGDGEKSDHLTKFTFLNQVC